MNNNLLAGIFVVCNVLLCSLILNAQDRTELLIKNSTLVAKNNNLPLWFHANQHGKIQSANQFLNISEVNIFKSSTNNKSKLGWNFGGNLIYALAQESYWQVNQAFAGVSFKGWEVKGGLFYDPIQYAGLSSTNGNLVRSGNARPYPNLHFFNSEFKPVPFMTKWLLFKFEFDEGLLNDNRFVENTHLHHKSIYFLIMPQKNWNITVGLEHYVMWGGTSKNEDFDKFPTDFNSYMRYILSSPGDSNSPEQEQLNAAGNHLGTYQIKFSRNLKNSNISIYLSHPFENHPGLEWRNWPDNLIGLHVSVNDKTKIISDVVYEITNTRHQNLTNSLIVNAEDQQWKHELYEDYFLNLLYKSGFTYHQMVIGSPLFFPVANNTDEKGNEWFAIQSNRFFSQHIGVKGNISKTLHWKGLLTYIQHLGTYPQPYEYEQKQLSGLFDIEYTNHNFPIEIGLSLAFDTGNSIQNNTGLQFSITKRW